jgi:hypothetical protein
LSSAFFGKVTTLGGGRFGGGGGGANSVRQITLSANFNF